MTILKTYDVQLPCWALPYLVNGDESGLENGEQAQVDAWAEQFHREAKSLGGYAVFTEAPGSNGEGHFSRSPEFGLHCNCEDYLVEILK
jgi:hypothetical protein